MSIIMSVLCNAKYTHTQSTPNKVYAKMQYVTVGRVVQSVDRTISCSVYQFRLGYEQVKYNTYVMYSLIAVVSQVVQVYLMLLGFVVHVDVLAFRIQMLARISLSKLQ